jgi:hypothetical protein
MSEKQGREHFEEPKVIATYGKEELEEVIRPHLTTGGYNDGICCPD